MSAVVRVAGLEHYTGPSCSWLGCQEVDPKDAATIKPVSHLWSSCSF